MNPNEPMSTVSPILNKFTPEVKNRCQQYVNDIVIPSNFSDCNATIASCEYTNVDGDIFSCRFRKAESKRIVSNIEIFTLNNFHFNALVDTGATISVISKKFLNSVESSLHKITPIVPFNIVLSIENSNDFKVTEKAEMCFKINNQAILWHFYIIDNLTNNIVLGMDFLNEYEVTIKCNPFSLELKPNVKQKPKKPFSEKTEYTNNKTVATSDVIYPSACDSLLGFPNPATKPSIPSSESDFSSTSFTTTTIASSNKNIRVSHDTTIPPMSFYRVPICSIKAEGDFHLSPRKEIEYALNLLIGNAIINFKDNHSSIFVCNATNKPQTLNDRTIIGTIEKCHDENILCNLDTLPCYNKETLASLNYTTTNNKSDDLIKNLNFGKNLSNDEKSQLIKLIKQYSYVFSHSHNNRGITNMVTHNIETGNAMPVRQRAYKQAYCERQKTRELTKELLNEGIIQYSYSPWSSPVVLVKKKDNSTRFCVDYRKLNEITKKDNYPLPRIDDALDRLSGAKYFSNMDCDQAYYQVPVNEQDKEKTAFITPDGLFEFNYMPFGLCNAPATFQRLMDVVLGRLKWTIALIYLDDIVVYSKTFSEHLFNLAQVFEALRRANLTLKPSKCNFGEDELLFLGHIISKDGISVNPAKIRAVENFPRPKRKRDVMSFLGLCSYYRRFIHSFAKIAKPLHSLTEDSVPFKWNDEAENAFQILKNKLVSSDVLAFPDDNAPTEIHCDASSYGLGATLVQIQNGKERVIAYASRCLKKHEKNYTATELECLAVIYAVSIYRPHLYGRKFKIVTDHCALCYMLNLKDPHGRLARWALRLQPYDYEIVYKNGRKHKDADALSRNPVDAAPPSEHETLDFAELLCSITDEFKNIGELQDADPKLYVIKEAIRQNDKNSKIKIDEYTIENNILYKMNNDENGRLWRICIPNKLRKKIIENVHISAAGHLGLLKTWTLVKSRFAWPKMYSHVRRYIMGCSTCQFCNKRGNAVPGPMQLMPPPSVPFRRIGIDFQGPYPTTKNRNTYIFVVVDHLTRYVEAWPVKSANTKCALAILEECIIFKHSCPSEIVCDRGSSFTSSLFREFCDKYHIKILLTTAYHPNTNGVCERVNGTLKRIIGKFVDDNHRNWDKFVNRAAFSINIVKHSVTGFSPYYLLHGREPYLPCDTALPTIPNYVDDEINNSHARRADEAIKTARKNTIDSQRRSKQIFDLKHPEVCYEIGDLVLVANFARKVGRVTKWMKKWYGPFEITKRLGPVNYIVKDLRQNKDKVLKNVSVRHLKLYYEEFHSNSDPEIVSDEHFVASDPDEYESDSYCASISYGDRNRLQITSRVAPSSGRNIIKNSHFDDNEISLPPNEEEIEIENSVTIIEPNSGSFHSAISSEESSSLENNTDNNVTLRRSTRTRKPVERYGDFNFSLKR